MHRLKMMFFSLFIPIITLVLSSFVLAEESISITSYYPSPYGVYNEIRLYPHAAPLTSCDSTTEGTMFYNSTAKEIQVCNGSVGWGSGASSFWAASGNNIYNTNTGDVGIGTNLPGEPLHIYSATGVGGEIKVENAASWKTADVHYKADGREWDAGAAGSNRTNANSFFIHDETAGLNRVIIDTNGRVGIGTETPKGTLDVNGTLFFAGDGGQPYINFPSPMGVHSGDEAFFLPTYTGDEESELRLYIEDDTDDRFSIWGNSCAEGDCYNLAVSKMQHYFQANGDVYHKGKLGIGTENPTATVHIYGDASIKLEIAAGGGPLNFPEIHFNNTNAGGREYVIGNLCPANSLPDRFFIFDKTANAYRFIIDASGRVGIGVDSPAYQLQLSTNSAAKPTSGTWAVPSDIRIKKDIQPFIDGLGVIEKINPVSYVLNGKAGLPLDEAGIGVVAQDIKDVAPYTIKTWKAKLEPTDSEETELYDFDANALTYVLINAIKEQQKQLKDLKLKIIELERN